jgi:hypothetical protein
VNAIIKHTLSASHSGLLVRLCIDNVTFDELLVILQILK